MRRSLPWLVVGGLIGLPVLALFTESLRFGAPTLVGRLALPEARHALWLTLEVSLFATLVGTLGGLTVALALVRARAGRIMTLLADLPMTVSPVVAGFLLFVLLQPSGWLWRLGWIHTVPAMVWVALLVSLPISVRELAPLLAHLGDEEERAAWTLGASRGEAFRRITLPALRPGLARAASLTFARALGEFGATIVVSGNVLGETQTLTLWVHQQAGDFDMAGAYAASLVLVFLSVLAFGLASYRSKRAGVVF
ncbi:sulfate ABC transporter permease subunit CysW [soil metagenome]